MSAIRVTLRCFSHVRQRLNAASLELTLPAGSTTADLEAHVRQLLGPSDIKMVFRIAVNQQFVAGVQALRDGDEVALLPPMQGGA
ncbi:MAG: MoaD/ThiS family protein [Deltaproteobacteria bacterium]|nr:MoaD/ThiS family protein [Deltaproteobacteria bacterium]